MRSFFKSLPFVTFARQLYLAMFILNILIVQVSSVSCNLELQNGWIDCGGTGWHIDNNTDIGGTSSLKSIPIENSGISRICRVVKGPATISYWWKTDANSQGIGQLNFMVNGERMYTCDSSEWVPESYDLRYAGDYILSWELIKWKSYPEGAGFGWIKDICIKSDTSNSVEPQKPMSSNEKNNENNIVYVGQKEDIANNTYTSFNEAIRHVSNHGIVRVNSGSYFENIVINKPLVLEGSVRNDTIVKGAGDVIRICSDEVEVTNLTIMGGYRGINLSNSQGCEIKNNNILRCTKGLELDTSDKSIISGNNISYNEIGIEVNNSSYCQINQNNINGMKSLIDDVGIVFEYSSSNLVDMNEMKDYNAGISIESHSKNNIITALNNYVNILTCDLYFNMETEDLRNSTIYNDDACEDNVSIVSPPNLCEDCPVIQKTEINGDQRGLI